MKVVKVRSPFIVEIPSQGSTHTGSQIVLTVWNNGSTEPAILSGVAITGTAGQFSCTATTIAIGNTITISGTLGGTGTIVGYTSPKTYYVIATNGTTTFTLSETLGGTAITTTAGTPTGLTYIIQIKGYYSLSKNNPSTTQKNTIYNVSNYVKEFIENIKPTKTIGGLSAGVEDVNEWCKFRVRKYWYNGTTYTELSNIEYVGVNGFSNYSDGNQNPAEVNGFILTNDAINKNILKTTSTSKNYLNFLIDVPSGGYLGYGYFSLDEANSIGINVGSLVGVYNYKIPLTNYPESGFLENGCRVRVRVLNSSFAVLYEKNVYVNALEECKYTPVECSYINRYGGWEFLTFFKQQTNTIAVKGTDYKLTQSAINYNTSIGQFKTFNTNGKQTVKLNTGFVDENYSELITDLLLSETVLLDGKPVTVKTQGSDLKTSLKDRLINYEMDFEYAYNLINDVV